MLEKETVVDVLNYVKCSEMPAPLKKGDVWVTAIAKVKKANNHDVMCIVENDGEGNPVIKKDFGSISMIMEVVEIYPLTVLDSNIVPDFRKKKELGEYLKRMGYDAAYVDALMESKEDADKAMIKTLVIKECVKAQLAREKYEQKIANEKNNENNETDTEQSDPTDQDNESEEQTGETDETSPAEQ